MQPIAWQPSNDGRRLAYLFPDPEAIAAQERAIPWRIQIVELPSFKLAANLETPLGVGFVPKLHWEHGSRFLMAIDEPMLMGDQAWECWDLSTDPPTSQRNGKGLCGWTTFSKSRYYARITCRQTSLNSGQLTLHDVESGNPLWRHDVGENRPNISFSHDEKHMVWNRSELRHRPRWLPDWFADFIRMERQRHIDTLQALNTATGRIIHQLPSYGFVAFGEDNATIWTCRNIDNSVLNVTLEQFPLAAHGIQWWLWLLTLIGVVVVIVDRRTALRRAALTPSPSPAKPGEGNRIMND